MKDSFKALKITDHVYWVGAIDWPIRDFHGYTTDRGSTYNAYLIIGDKNILIDTVKAPFLDEMMARIASVIKPEDIDYIISDHSEMDHTGALPATVAAVKPDKVFASVMGVKALARHYHMDREIVAVKDGETKQLGNFNFTFVETRMLHWPDSMFTYFAEDSLLFSQDGFGMHLATSQRFADEVDPCIIHDEASRYYANIILPFSPIVANLLKKMAGMRLDIKMIAPDHGPIWRGEGIKKVIDWYATWAAQKPANKAVVVFDTMWHSTEKMARAIAEGLKDGGSRVKVMPMHSHHRSDVIAELLCAGAIAAGSSTLNNNIFPSMADVLTYVKGLKPRNLIGQAFGSYGWSGESVPQLVNILKEMKVQLVGEPISVEYVPDDAALKKCYGLGKAIAARLAEISRDAARGSDAKEESRS
jgi:flavorubredoxin